MTTHSEAVYQSIKGETLHLAKVLKRDHGFTEEQVADFAKNHLTPLTVATMRLCQALMNEAIQELVDDQSD